MNITAFAQYAGVSKAAVSRYFNGGYLSAEKRAQIAAAVEATGYRPSMQAQMLRTRRTRQIGVIMPRLSSESCARMVEGISRVLDDQNYQLLLINTANDNTREVRALDTLRHDTVDGIILIATMFTPEHHAVLQSLHVPVVIVGQQYPGFSCVFHDDFGAAQAATAHMLQKGRRKPGYLGVTLLDKAVGLARREGFDSALRDAGLVPQPQRMSIAKFNMESGYHQADQLFGRAPGLDCLFCATDSIALGALQYCRSHSLRVPEDIMIAAVGDNRIGRVAYVPLTSAHLHYRTAGDKAARARMVEGNLRLVLSVVQRFAQRGENLDDLFQVGCIGLIKAIDNFDPAQPVRFSTYGVPMIIGEIRRFLRDNNALRVSRTLRDTAYRAMQARETLEKQLGREPTMDEIATAAGLARREVTAALESVVEPLSLDEPVYTDGGDAMYVIDQVRDPDSEESWISGLQFRDTVAALTPREKRIMELRYLRGKTQMEVAQEIGISQAQVSRLEKGALQQFHTGG